MRHARLPTAERSLENRLAPAVNNGAPQTAGNRHRHDVVGGSVAGMGCRVAHAERRGSAHAVALLGISLGQSVWHL